MNITIHSFKNAVKRIDCVNIDKEITSVAGSKILIVRIKKKESFLVVFVVFMNISYNNLKQMIHSIVTEEEILTRIYS